MRACNENKKTYIGFTLTEMLTALAVIAVLLALLIPALSMVQKKAMVVKQRAQFHAIEVGLEAFRSDWGDYPPSEYNMTKYGNGSVASFRLAEALIGGDGFGFHPNSVFYQDYLFDQNGDGTFSAAETVYHAATDLAWETAAQNRAARKGPYLELETANAVKLQDIYGANTGSLSGTMFVLADAFSKKMRATGKEVGMPILYYRANVSQIGMDPVRANWGTNTYNLNDSYAAGSGIISLTVPFQSSKTTHDLNEDAADDGINWFYRVIANPNFTSPPRPYRANSFLLQSAGPDGLYGTADDLFNF
ncbi:MAG TPA: type II secretion system protein [Anaerohalosphaeraceae bacterium]|nr:type II secretion system protein [Anaerohalosphaeraceae bacterium]HOL89988.1 type II secretion system protein [Anaerohalosphaeraceae bacterium]HPP56536.1 type II secretion system protein [Anaerohalosphaeraceae bacterium]